MRIEGLYGGVAIAAAVFWLVFANGCDGDDEPTVHPDVAADAGDVAEDAVGEVSEDVVTDDVVTEVVDEIPVEVTEDPDIDVTEDPVVDVTDDLEPDVLPDESPDGDAGREPGQWTVLVYMLADCDLEAFGMSDLEEIATVGSSDDVRWVFQVDRAVDGTEGNYSDAGVLNLENWETAKRILVEEGVLVELADLGEVNMGLPATLTDFIGWGAAEFPAEHYSLILWDHGGAWVQFGPDESHDDPLTLAEISTGLEDGLLAAGLASFDLLGFDACLMANAEVAYELRSFADYFVASEETEPGHGWGWTGLGEAVNGTPAMTAAELGQAVADTYMAHGQAVHPPGAPGLTMSVIDLSAMDALATAMTTIAARLPDVLTSDGGFTQLGQVRVEVEEYGTEPNPSENMGVVDLGHFLGLVLDVDAEWATFIEPAQTALDSAITYNTSGQAKSNATGLTIYFPAEGDMIDEGAWVTYQATDWHTNTVWGDFLDAYYTLEEGDTTAPTIEDLVLNTDGANPVITATTTLFDLADVNVFLGVLVDDSVFVMGTELVDADLISEVEGTYQLEYEWDLTWPYFAEQVEEPYEPTNATILPLFEYSVYQPYFYETCSLFLAPAEYRSTIESEDWLEVTLQFVWCDIYGFVTVEFAGAYFDESGTPAEIKLVVGGQVRPVWIEIVDDGEAIWAAPEDEETYIPITEDGFTFFVEAVPAGGYVLGFIVNDIAGNSGSEFVSIDVVE